MGASAGAGAGAKYRCRLCKLDMAKKNSLARHYKTVHNIPWDRIVNLVGRSKIQASTASSRSRSRLTSTSASSVTTVSAPAIGAYKCVCGKAFTSRYGLSGHKANCHGRARQDPTTRTPEDAASGSSRYQSTHSNSFHNRDGIEGGVDDGDDGFNDDDDAEEDANRDDENEFEHLERHRHRKASVTTSSIHFVFD